MQVNSVQPNLLEAASRNMEAQPQIQVKVLKQTIDENSPQVLLLQMLQQNAQGQQNASQVAQQQLNSGKRLDVKI